MSVKSDTVSQTNDFAGRERFAVRQLKDQSVEQSSNINHSTLVGSNYNMPQLLGESSGVLEDKSTVPTNQLRDLNANEYFSGFDDNDETVYADS